MIFQLVFIDVCCCWFLHHKGSGSRMVRWRNRKKSFSNVRHIVPDDLIHDTLLEYDKSIVFKPKNLFSSPIFFKAKLRKDKSSPILETEQVSNHVSERASISGSSSNPISSRKEIEQKQTKGKEAIKANILHVLNYCENGYKKQKFEWRYQKPTFKK